MPIDANTTFEISTRGLIDDETVDRARERITRVGGHCREVITHVELRITDDQGHPTPHDHARAEATLSVKHGPVRAHAVAPTVSEAVDHMIERLRRRVDRHEAKLHREGTKRHDGVATEGSWRHGDVSTAPRRPLALGRDDATVVRRKSFAAAPMSVEEALFDMEILDHRFYLFEEAETGAVAVVSHTDDDYCVAIDSDADLELPAAPVVVRGPGPVVLDKPDAIRALDSADEPFVFYRPGADATPRLLYRRFDGQYGIIELAGSSD